MEAFPSITLLTADTVLANAIPAQLQHMGIGACTVLQNWEQMQGNLLSSPPALAIIDCQGVAALPTLPELRQMHPLMALLGIGEAQQAEYFSTLPLAAFVKRPLSMPSLLRSIEQLQYERGMRAGQQALALPRQVQFLPAERLLRYDSGTVELTDKESGILLCLYHHRHGWTPRQQLLEEVWGYNDSITTHTLETHLYRLRTKLREIFGEQELIVTRQGNYQLALA